MQLTDQLTFTSNLALPFIKISSIEKEKHLHFRFTEGLNHEPIVWRKEKHTTTFPRGRKLS